MKFEIEITNAMTGMWLVMTFVDNFGICLDQNSSEFTAECANYMQKTSKMVVSTRVQLIVT